MGRDILSFSEPVPAERLGLENLAELNRRPSADSAASWPDPDAAATPPRSVEPTTPDTSTTGQPDRSRLHLAITVIGLLAAAGIGFYLWSTAGRVDIAYNGLEIANADEMLILAESTMVDTVASDGGTVSGDSRCFFAPGDFQPTVVCGPVWLGVSTDETPWLLVDSNYQVADGVAVGEVGPIRGTTDADRRELNRPDNVRPAEPGAPVYPTTGPRLSDGRLLVDVEPLLEAALATFVNQTSSDDTGINASDDAACFLVQGPDLIHDLPVTASDVWCGPARSTSSDPAEVWAPIRVSYDEGTHFGSVRFVETSAQSTNLRAVPEGATLFRPDGRQPPDIDTLDRPPVATDFTTVLDYRIDLSPGQDPGGGGSGVLVTDRYRIEFDDLVRVDQAGSGARSFTAPPGHDLVIGLIAAADGFVDPRGAILIDGSERPLPRWVGGDDGSTLVVAVPESASDVAVTVEGDGRPQTMSLLDGTLAAGYPLALYRPTAEVAQPFSLRIPMPVGEAVLVAGSLDSAVWSAKDQDGNWLPEGTSDLTFQFDDWDVSRPCCDVRIDEVTARFTLTTAVGESPAESTGEAGDQPGSEPESETDPAGRSFDDLREDVERSPSTDGPRFRVPESITGSELLLDVTVAYTIDGTAGTTSAQQLFEVSLP